MLTAYKLVRKLKNGDITPLFINKKQRLEYHLTYTAELHETKGFAVRKGWHCCAEPIAPHLSKKGRVWVEVEMLDYQIHKRPVHQGGIWYTANLITFIREVITTEST